MNRPLWINASSSFSSSMIPRKIQGARGSASLLDQAQSGAAAFAVDALVKGYSIGLIRFADKATLSRGPIRAKERGIEIIAIGTDDADKDFLSRLASRSDLMVKVSRELLGQSIASAAKMLPGPSR